jgi:hypothetical protein
MVDLGNDIDEIFRQRFEGLKDFTRDPSIGWSAVEAGMAHSTVFTAAVSNSASFVLFKSAAILGSLMVITGIAQSDKVVQPENQQFDYQLVHSTPPEESQPDVYISAETAAIADKAAMNQSNVSINNFPVFSEPEVIEPVALAEAVVNQNSQIGMTVESESDAMSSYVTRDLRIGASIAYMPMRVKSHINPVIESRNDVMEEPQIEHWANNHIWYLRGSLRIGSGESNSFEVESKWKANPSFAFGYGFSLSDRSYITTEIGWLRRSGNGIERTRDIDLDPIITSLTGTPSVDGSSYVIHESLVATRMDYIHIPVTYNQLFNDHWSVSVGGFCDYLISAENEGYVVYNNTQYRASVTGKTELNSKDGLNKLRYGALLGAERHIGRQLSAFGNMMVPLNSAVDASSEYRVIDETNRLIDLQMGLIYRI